MLIFSFNKFRDNHYNYPGKLIFLAVAEIISSSPIKL